MKHSIFVLGFLIISLSVNANECDEVFCNSPRICQLVPTHWLEYPLVEPAIPADYTLSSTDGESNRTGAIFWGKKNDLEMYTRDQSSPISSPIFRVRHSSNVAQTGVDSFSGEEALYGQLVQLGLKDVKIEKLSWGSYPVLTVEAKLPNAVSSCFAWIGLNSNGWVLMVNLIPSPVQSSLENANIWNTFIQKTEQLGEPDFFIAQGMDMREGYTNYREGTISLRVSAEKRISDVKLQVISKPISSNTVVQINEITEGKMGSKWKYLEPCTKVQGCITETNGNTKNVVNTVITVLTKSVEKFSFIRSQEDDLNNIVIIQKESE